MIIKNIGQKIKRAAVVSFFIEAVSAFIGAFFTEDFLIGIGVFFGGISAAYFAFLVVYGFGILVAKAEAGGGNSTPVFGGAYAIKVQTSTSPANGNTSSEKDVAPTSPNTKNKSNVFTEYVGNSSIVTLPDTIVEIGPNAFKYCSNITEVKIPSTVNKIGRGAFNGCTSLVKVNIPSGVDRIYGNTFKNCTSLKYISLPESVREIDSGAFMFCSALEHVYIPGDLDNIYFDAFAGCLALTIHARKGSFGQEIAEINSINFEPLE